MNKKYIDIFRQIASADLTKLDDPRLAAVINCFMDGVQAELAGVCQGWSASADYSLGDANIEPPVDETPDGYLALAIQIAKGEAK